MNNKKPGHAWRGRELKSFLPFSFGEKTMPKFLVEWLKSLDSREQTELVKWLYDTWPDDIQSSLIDILNGCAED